MPRDLMQLKLMLFVWLQTMLGKTEGAENICRITGVKMPSQENAFKRDCLAYFLMTIATDGLEEYEYEGRGEKKYMSELVFNL